MRVLHIGKYYPPFAGGMENFLGDLLPALLSLGITPAALVHAHNWQPSGRAGTSVIEGIQVTRAPTWGRLFYAPISPLFALSLKKVLAEFKPDILHLHLPNTSAFWVLQEPLAQKLPWIIHWHSDVIASNLNIKLNLAYPLYRPFEQKLLKKATAIIATSPPYLQTSTALAPWLNKCHVIPLGLNTARLKTPDFLIQQTVQTLWSQKKFRILAIGRLTYYKGHTTLIRALADLPEAQLILVGEGEQRRSLEALIRKLNLISRVHLLGHLPAPILQGLLSSCDCVCLPSIERTEAFGLVLLEAMYYGRAVVSSDVPGAGMSWIITHNKTGVLAPPNNVMALINAFKLLIHNLELRKNLGLAGKIRLKECFTLPSIAYKITDLYNDSCNNF